MHSNRDAKRIARRRGHHPGGASAVVDPEELSAYRVSTEEKHHARQSSSGYEVELSARPIYNQEPLYGLFCCCGAFFLENFSVSYSNSS
jgi:hypothetical protein